MALSDDDRLNWKMTLEMLNYHSIVSHSRKQNGISEDIYQATNQYTPAIYTYLKGFGNIIDKRGKKIFLADHVLPISVF